MQVPTAPATVPYNHMYLDVSTVSIYLHTSTQHMHTHVQASSIKHQTTRSIPPHTPLPLASPCFCTLCTLPASPFIPPPQSSTINHYPILALSLPTTSLATHSTHPMRTRDLHRQRLSKLNPSSTPARPSPNRLLPPAAPHVAPDKESCHPYITTYYIAGPPSSEKAQPHARPQPT